MNGTLLGLATGSGLILVFAAWLMLRVSDRDLLRAARTNAARGRWVRPEATDAARNRTLMATLQRALTGLGRILLRSGLLAGRTMRELQTALDMSGFRNRTALPLFLGAKLVLMVIVPPIAWLASGPFELQPMVRLVVVAAGFIAGLLAPDAVMRQLRKRYIAGLEAGLPDALDLLVICAQAGLSLTPAMARVAAELRQAQPQVTAELELTVRELEILSSPARALGNLAERTGLDTLRRLASTLVQTMQYGTPLTDALRTLSAELRQQALTRFEARAARLPVLLTLPMIVFILPCVFIIAGGPAALRVMGAMGH